MSKPNIKFDDYVAMIRSRAHYYAACYGLDYSDVESQGFEIYCISLRDFNPFKATFSTFLYRNLSGRLKDYCKAASKAEIANESLDKTLSDESAETHLDILPARKYELSSTGLKQYAKDVLSPDGYTLFCWILDRQWENYDQNNSIIRSTIWAFWTIKKWKINRIYKTWNEIRDFWRSSVLASSYLYF